MNKFLLSISLGLISLILHAQFAEQQIISTSTLSPIRSQTIDIDGDGFIDVLSGSGQTYSLVWYKNMDGLGTFSTEKVIQNIPAYYLSIQFVDVNTDGFEDLLVLESNPKTIAWFEHLDGNGHFGPRQEIASAQSSGIRTINAQDVDDDGDLDLLVKMSNTFIDWIVWRENIDGNANFGGSEMIVDGQIFLYPPVFVDIDNDGMQDLLSAHEDSGPAQIVWYKNLGNAQFGSEQTIYLFEFFVSDFTSIYNMHYADINMDGMNDLVIKAHNDDLGSFIYWLENLNQQGDFGDLQLIANENAAFRIYDLDNDGDNDLLFWDRFNHDISWKRNDDGLGTFGDDRLITTEVHFPSDARAADIDGDGLLDVVSASNGGNKMAWYKNTGVLGIFENNMLDLHLYPNPTNQDIHVVSSEEISTINIFSSSGQQLTTILKGDSIDLSAYSTGVYFMLITATNGESAFRKVVKE